jgi:hypothetical protein
MHGGTGPLGLAEQEPETDCDSGCGHHRGDIDLALV